MKYKLSIIAVAVLGTLAASANAQVFTNKEPDATTTYLNAIGAPAAWARGITGKGSIIAIIDNGFATEHPDIKNNVLEFRNFYPGTSLTWGLHGTQMASIAAGVANGSGTVGAAPDAKLLLGQVGSGGTTSGINMSSVYSAMTWAESKGASVINLSLGLTYDSTFRAGTTLLDPNVPGVYKALPTYTKPKFGALASLYGYSMTAMQEFALATKNTVIVASAGNSGTGYAQFPGAFATQTDADGNLLMGGRVLIVGNVKGDGKGGWVIDPNSNKAGSLCTNIVGTTCQDKYYVKDFYVVAPGSAIWGAVPDQARTATAIKSGQTNGVGGVSGTSSSAALVSGGVALMKQAWPQLSPAQIVQLVKTTATDLGKPGVDEIYGYGMVNFDRATQPSGKLMIASVKETSTVSATTSSVTTTGVVSAGTAPGFKTSSVLQNVMAVDDIGRHYGVDFTRAETVRNISTYQFSSPWLALNPSNYREMVAPVGLTGTVKLMKTDTGSAAELQWSAKDMSYSVQVGNMNEQQGFLGNYGVGALGFGDSTTSYAQVGVAKQWGRTTVFANYGLAVTDPTTARNSMVQFDGRIISSSWKLGVGESSVFTENDQVSLSVISPVAVRKGSATVTAVTGYQFTETEQGTVQTQSVVSKEAVGLSGSVQPMDLVLGYAVMNSNMSKVTVNFARQYNVGGVSGQTANGVGIMFNKTF